MKRAFLPLLSTILFLFPSPAECWWETGHQTVARIAAFHLNATARARVAQLLGVEDSTAAVADAMAAASIWADQVKYETHTGNWHFIDLTLQDGRDNIADRCPNNDCISAALQTFSAQLKADDTDDDARWSDADALRFVIHFIGDLHQPLHAISNADQGGNCELLDSPVGEARNLHAVWDGALVNALTPDAVTLATELETQIEGMASGDVDALTQGDVADWIWESHRLAIVDVYRKLDIPKQEITFPTACAQAPAAISGTRWSIDSDYVTTMGPVVKDQLTKAGLRLAKVLNGVLLGS